MRLRADRDEVLKVVGMHCSTCVATVSRAASSVKGVKDVRVNLATGEVRLSLGEGARLSEVVKSIRRAGYDVVTQRVDIAVEAREEEMPKLRELLEGAEGVLDVRTGSGLVSVELNPLRTSAETILEELRKRGYRVSLAKEGIIARSDFRDSSLRLISASVLSPLVLLINDFPVALALSAAVLLLSGVKFLRGAYRALRNGTANMDVLVSLSSVTAWAYGLVSRDLSFLQASSLLITFVLAGKTLEAWLKERISKEVPEVLRVKARRLVDGEEREVDARELRPGDVVVLRSGDTVPADGVIDEGEVYVDESPLTGEPTPVLKGKGDPLIGGSTVASGFAKLYVTRSGERTYLAQVAEAVRRAEAARLPVQDLVDKVSAYFVPTVVVFSVFVFLVWRLALGYPLSFGLTISIAVLASACPCGFGLATPTAIAVGIRRLLKRGIVVRDGEALQRLTEVRTFVIDKTGTLTEGKMKVVKFEGEVKLASCLERLSSHPIAKAISELSEGQCEVGDFTEFPGKGVHGVVEGRTVLVGSRDFVLANCNGEDRGADLLVCVDGRMEGWVWLDDPLRPEAIEAVRRLKAMGYRVVIATGDSSSKAESVARALGVEVRKGLSPEDKAELVRELGKVAFVGDGINDALALKEAFVGVAVSSGTDLAKVAGDVMIPSIGALPGLLEGARRTVRKVKENVAWALAYNSVLIPIASGVLYPFYLPPEWAALAMSMNSVSVVLWSLVQ